MRYFIIILSLFILFTLPCSALTFLSTYSDLTSTSSQVTNLINYAMNYDSFITSDYVCFRPSQYEYYIVWGKLELNNNVVSSSDPVEYIRYYREGNYGDYQYEYGSDPNFSLFSAFINTSNINTYGFSSSVHNAYYFNFVVQSLLIFILALVFSKFLLGTRRHV